MTGGFSPILRERFGDAGLKPGSYFNVGWDAALKRRTTQTTDQARIFQQPVKTVLIET